MPGRIVSGDEVRFLQLELEKRTGLTKNVVLQLADGDLCRQRRLGALVRIFGVLRAERGDLKLCQLSRFVVQVLQATNLLSVFHPYHRRKKAIRHFPCGRNFRRKRLIHQHARRLSRHFTGSSRVSESAVAAVGLRGFSRRDIPPMAVALVVGTKPGVVVWPGDASNESAIEKFRESAPNVRLLHLPPDFSTSEAEQAGSDLVNRLRSLL